MAGPDPGFPEAGGRGDLSPPAVSVHDLLRWRVIRDPALPGHVNMARDHALTLFLGPDEGVLRLYRWDPPSVSFGRNEPAKGLYSQEVAHREGVSFVRRPTGGRAVLHHRELTYSMVFGAGRFGGPRRSYHLINRGLLLGLRSLGAAAELAVGTGPALPPDAGPCFRAPAEGEVTALGRKLVGSAQVRLGDRILQHGSLILDGDQGALGRIRLDGAAVDPPATVRSLLGEVPDLDFLASSLQEGLETVLGGEWRAGTFQALEEGAAQELEARYLDPHWTWRL
jgi:lipoyl(octanoyl) transferase